MMNSPRPRDFPIDKIRCKIDENSSGRNKALFVVLCHGAFQGTARDRPIGTQVRAKRDLRTGRWAFSFAAHSGFRWCF